MLDIISHIETCRRHIETVVANFHVDLQSVYGVGKDSNPIEKRSVNMNHIRDRPKLTSLSRM